MYIPLEIIYLILSTVGIVALVYLILTLNNVNKLVKNANDLVHLNSENINKSLVKLPDVVDNFAQLSENVKDVSEVVTDVTADFIVTKENVKCNVDLIVELLNIVKQVFKK